ncbi:zinc ribbon domain-containing protein [Marisediminicola sp. LYQ134]|uniref:zinc ribbon domain-containing protein n=1 Tax=unclassified Marisediminicola TaxID=2618316 RepID=UPI003983A1DD
MTTCTNCAAELSPRWKFCIHCGTPVVRSEAAAPPATPLPVTPPPVIPPAVRPADLAAPPSTDHPAVDHRFDDPLDEDPEADATAPTERRIDVLIALSALLALGGIALVVTMVIVLGGRE